jgi:hypothetical protein
MGLFSKLKKKISLKNVSPIAKVGSAIKTPIKKVVSTGKVGIKDVISVSPAGLGASIIKSGTSNVTDVVVDKPIIKKDEINTFADDTAIETKTEATSEKLINEPTPKKENKTLLYAGIGLGVLLVIGVVYKISKKK